MYPCKQNRFPPGNNSVNQNTSFLLTHQQPPMPNLQVDHLSFPPPVIPLSSSPFTSVHDFSAHKTSPHVINTVPPPPTLSYNSIFMAPSTFPGGGVVKSRIEMQRVINDEDFIASFGNLYSNCNTRQKTANISDMKEHLERYFIVLKALEKSVDRLNDYSKLTEDELTATLNEITEYMTALEKCEISLDINDELIRTLKRKIKKRARKRASIKKRKMTNPSINAREIIEHFMDQAKKEHEKNEQMKAMKEQADLILADVMKKKSEANYYKQHLNAILKLHEIKSKKRSQEVRADNEESSDVVQIESLTKNLIEMWESALKEYALEETGLRVMMDDDDSRNDGVSYHRKRNGKYKFTEFLKIRQNWLVTLFGSAMDKNDVFYKSINDFITLRNAWDKYVVYDDNDILASSIPIGWIVPPDTPTDEKWKKHIIN